MEIHSYKSDGDIRLYDIADLHRGNYAFDHQLLEKVIDAVASDKSAFWVSTGDLMEMALKDSKSFSYGMSPETEFELLCKELKPIAKKCLGVVKSNHHSRHDRAVGMSIDKRICEKLGIDDRFLGAIGVINIICGRAAYYIAMHHGSGGGRLRGSKTTNLNRFCDVIPGADIYLEGHTHSFDHHIDLEQYIDRKRGLLTEYPAHFVCTGHFINWRKSYATDLKLKSMPLGVALMELKAADAGNFANKKVTVDLFN